MFSESSGIMYRLRIILYEALEKYWATFFLSKKLDISKDIAKVKYSINVYYATSPCLRILDKIN